MQIISCVSQCRKNGGQTFICYDVCDGIRGGKVWWYTWVFVFEKDGWNSVRQYPLASVVAAAEDPKKPEMIQVARLIQDKA